MSGLPRSSHALVTGGGRGIGREIAATLARAGLTVTVLGRNRATLDEAIASGAAHFAGVADVADQAAVSAAIAEAAARQPIDMLIANAGIAESAPFGKSDAALFRRMMDVNFRAWLHHQAACLDEDRPAAALSRSHPPQVSRAMPCSAYSAAKHAVVGLVRPWRWNWRTRA
jgi:NAD(P)-dependent dehydrogenase (short-subunit alcohol dehydrogenase family)